MTLQPGGFWDGLCVIQGELRRRPRLWNPGVPMRLRLERGKRIFVASVTNFLGVIASEIKEFRVMRRSWAALGTEALAVAAGPRGGS